MYKKPINQISFKEEKNCLLRSQQRETMKNIFQFGAVGNMISILDTDCNMTNFYYLKSSKCISFTIENNRLYIAIQNDNSLKIIQSRNTSNHQGFVTKEVPVESFVGSSAGTSSY
jgi:hypothetical protein